jgi:hypothetical protein
MVGYAFKKKKKNDHIEEQSLPQRKAQERYAARQER